MDILQARTILTALRDRSEGILDPSVREALGVLLADAPTIPAAAPPAAPPPAAAPAPPPVAAVTGPVGFIGALLLPDDVWLSDDDRWVPYEEVSPALAWNRLLSWGGPGMLRPETADRTWLEAYVEAVLRGQWSIDAIENESTITLTLSRSITMTLPALPSMVQKVELRGASRWEFRRGASTYDFLTLLAHVAAEAGFPPERELACGEGRAVRVPLLVYRASIGDALRATVSSVEAYVAWTERLADAIRIGAGEAAIRGRTPGSWSQLSSADQEGWAFWVRNHPGMLRLELALRGFFANGGEEAVVSLFLHQEYSHDAPDAFLPGAFAAAPGRVCAPGLGSAWQAALGTWAAANGSVAVLEAPRFLATEPPDNVILDDDRWTASSSHYEAYSAASAAAETSVLSVEPGSAGVAPWLVVDNPLAMGSYDAVRIAPPSGHRAAKATGAVTGAHAPAVALPEGRGVTVAG